MSQKLNDCATIAKAFQKKMMTAPNEGAVIGTMMPSVVMMQVNATSAANNLVNAINPPIDPSLLEQLQALGEEGLKVEFPGDLPDIGTGNQLVKLGLDWLEECIPCNLRLLTRAELSLNVSDILVDIMDDMLQNYLKELAFVVNMLNATEIYQDACLLLNALGDVCIPDLQRMISLLSSILYRETSKEIMQQVDVMKLLIMPIFQPIFSNITSTFSMYKSMVTDPLQCVVSNLDRQLEKMKTGGIVSNPQVSAIEARTAELDRALGGLAGDPAMGFFGTANAEAIKPTLLATQSVGNSYDDGISAIQNSLGTAVFELRRLVTSGIATVESVLYELQTELQKFVGGGQNETLDFLLRQYEKLLMVRMIQFISAIVQAKAGGFTCAVPNAESANVVLTQFFDNFLGPNSPIVIQVDPDTNDVILLVENDATAALADENGPLVLDSTGDEEVDNAVNAILDQATTPVTVKPRCFFETQTDDDNKLAEYLALLDATEV